MPDHATPAIASTSAVRRHFSACASAAMSSTTSVSASGYVSATSVSRNRSMSGRGCVPAPAGARGQQLVVHLDGAADHHLLVEMLHRLAARAFAEAAHERAVVVELRDAVGQRTCASRLDVQAVDAMLADDFAAA